MSDKTLQGVLIKNLNFDNCNLINCSEIHLGEFKRLEYEQIDEGIIQHPIIEDNKVYDSFRHHHGNMLIIAIESGGRGYYPGCTIHCTLNGTLEVRTDKSSDSPIITILENTTVEIVDLTYSINSDWVKIKYDGNYGFANIKTCPHTINYI